MEKAPLISIVIPVLDEEGNVQQLLCKLREILPLISERYEIIFVDDGSQDQTFTLVKAFHQADARVRGISFSRNFGHQIALLAGLQAARGEVVISMDGDMQHPPEVLPSLWQKYLEGYDIVNTRRMDAQSIGWFKKLTSRGFYRLLGYLSEVPIEPAAADFRLMNRKAVDAFLTIPERDRFMRGLVSWMGFRQAIVPYQAAPRAAGKSKYSLRKMLRFGLDGITSFSARPLRISFVSGLFISIVGLIYALYALVQYFLGQTIAGWTSMLVSLLIIGGIMLINLGIVGEYIARIFHEVKARPLYFIQEQTDTLYEQAEAEKTAEEAR